MMKVEEVLAQARDTMTVKRVFGEPIEKDGMTIIPVAKVAGGGGGGGGQDPEGSTGSGVGYGVNAQPLGAYVIKEGKLSWQPAVDVNRVIFGGQLVAIFALIALWKIFGSRSK